MKQKLAAWMGGVGLVVLCVVGQVEAAAVLGGFPVGTELVFSDDFTKQKPYWSFSSPSAGFLGELNNNVNVSAVTVGISVPTTLTANLSFDLLGFRTLDGVNCCTDTLTFSANGATALTGAYSHNPAINRLLSNPSGASVTQLWVNTPPPGVGGANSGHRFEVPNVQLNAGVNTFTWSYSSLQSFADEAWGLDNVTVTANLPQGVPEPGTLALLMLALPLLASRRFRRR